MRRMTRAATIISILLVNIAVIAVSTSCTGKVYPVPEFQYAPEVMQIEEVLEDYRDNPAAAAEKYEGKYYLFPGIDIDYVLSPRLKPEEYQLGGIPHFKSGIVIFKTKYLYDVDRLAPDFVVDVYGEISNWAQGYLYIGNCTFAIAKGGDMPAPGVY